MATIPRRWSWSSAAKVSRQASFTRSLRRWRGRAAESRGAIASRACRFLPDPVSLDKRLLIPVSTFSKKDVFGPDLGAVVAQGVDTGLTAEADDVRHHMGWRAVAASAQQAWLMARYRAEEDN